MAEQEYHGGAPRVRKIRNSGEELDKDWITMQINEEKLLDLIISATVSAGVGAIVSQAIKETN